MSKPNTVKEHLEEAQAERFKIGHAAELLELLGDVIGTPHSKRSDMEWQAIGLRVEYVAGLILDHNRALGAALAKAEG